MEVQEWAPAESIARQLRWCLAAELGQEKKARFGPFTIGLIAAREFDRHGDRPELAAAACDIERQAKKAFP